MKKQILILISVLSVFTSCSTSVSYNQVENDTLNNAILNFNYSYKSKLPGKVLMSYNTIWTGYDEDSSPTYLSKIYKQNTYLVEYSEEINEEFYFIYFNKNNLNQIKEEFVTYRDKNSNDYNNFHFSSEENIIDGKYIYIAKALNLNDIKIYKSNDISSMNYMIDDYQLGLCLESKYITLIDNISQNKSINRKLELFNLINLKYNESSKKLESYTFENDENKNVLSRNKLFNQTGKKIESYPAAIEKTSYIYCPTYEYSILGTLKSLHISVEDSKILLPKYNLLYSFNLLDENIDYSSSTYILCEDVYRDFKNLFQNAFIEDSTYSDNQYSYAYFDYEKVANIIATNS